MVGTSAGSMVAAHLRIGTDEGNAFARIREGAPLSSYGRLGAAEENQKLVQKCQPNHLEGEDEEQEQFKISNIYFDSMLRQLKVGDNEYKLSPKENELLKLLCLHRNDFMPRDLALRKIWKKENYFTARSMDVYIAKLRKLLKDDEGLEIINVHGEGFRLLVKN